MKKKIAVIGFGGMGSWHVNHALKSDVLELAGIYDIDEKKSALARERGIYAYASLDEVINDKSVELVTIAIPNDVHLDTVVRCLKGGKHVICEKPVALSSSDLEEMIAASKESGKLFTVHQNRRFDVDYLAMQQLADSGEIGKPLRIESRIHGSRGIPSDWRGEKEHGGGMILDWGIHLIDQLMLIYKDEVIDTINCTLTNITNKEVDDGFYLTITFKSGAVAFVEVGTYNFIALPRFYMKAEKGSALIQDWREKTQVAKCKYWHENDVLPVQTAAGLTKTMAPRDSVTLDTYELEIPKSDVHDFYRNFVDAIDKKAEQIVTHDQMRLDMKIMEQAFKSAELNQTIKFEY
ncbi:MAG: Gfo/Idh/MocA family oxidoreductase [Ruminococcaceae bacterium]|nr:Gfo/Idh/MocA family oxidoreductase [Oscillospiraceae bacterium]